jgi:hypothetical protein
MFDLKLPTFNKPGSSSRTLEVRKNYYVVFDGNLFHYYPIKVTGFEEDKPLLRFEKTPPVLMEGIALIGPIGGKSKPYFVTVEDLKRGLIRKSRELKQANPSEVQENEANNSGSPETISNQNSPTGSSSSSSSAVQRARFQPSGSPMLGMEEDSRVDAAWSEQIGSLLSFISEKEGEDYEIESASQSGLVNEDDTVQDT